MRMRRFSYADIVASASSLAPLFLRCRGRNKRPGNNAIASRGLGRIKRQVGALYQIIEIAIAYGICAPRTAEACRNPQALAAGQFDVGSFDRQPDTFRNDGRILGCRVREQRHELFAAMAHQ